MIPDVRRVAVFALEFVPLFVVFFALYMAIVPTYERVVRTAANAMTLRMHPATEIQPKDQRGGWEAYSFTPQSGRERLRGWGESSIHLVLLSLATLPALLLATPAPFLQRLRLLGLALPLVFVGHVLAIVVISRGILCLRDAPGTFSCLVGLRISYASGQIVAAALWVLLTWRYWFQPGAKASGATPGTGGAHAGS